MSLTGTPFLVTTIALAAVAVLLPLALWSRVRGPALVRGAARMKSGPVTPFILVAPRTTLIADADTGCANIPGRVNADSWLSVDVPKMVTDTFRAESGPGGWAVAGYSAGAHCAAKLAIAHPDRYRAAVSMSGYNDPMGEPVSLTAQNSRLRAANNPYLILKHDPVPPAIALYVSGESGDGYEAGLALRKVAKPPTAVDVVFLPRSAGGHNMALWRPQITTVFRWLTQQFDAGGRKAAGSPTGRPLPHGPSTAGSTRAALASGTASRAAAVRRP